MSLYSSSITNISESTVRLITPFYSDGNKRRYQIKRKIVEDKAALTAAIVQLHEQQAEFRLPIVDELLNTDNFVWPWERLGTSI